jgi:glucose dehydrogenase
VKLWPYYLAPAIVVFAVTFVLFRVFDDSVWTYACMFVLVLVWQLVAVRIWPAIRRDHQQQQ